MTRSCKRILVVCTLAAVATGGGCGKPQPSFDDLMKEGRRAYDAKDYPGALSLFQQATDKDPERPEPAFNEGRCYAAMAEEDFRASQTSMALLYIDRATANFDRAIGSFPGFRAAVTAKANALRRKGNYQAAQEIAAWAAAQSAFNPNLLVIKAREYVKSGDMDKAQLTYEQAASIDPDNAVVHAELGLLYMRCGNDSAAIKSLKRAYELDPGAPGVVSALSHLGALSEARESE